MCVVLNDSSATCVVGKLEAFARAILRIVQSKRRRWGVAARYVWKITKIYRRRGFRKDTKNSNRRGNPTATDVRSCGIAVATNFLHKIMTS